jgi:hypothetical protein
VPGAETDLAEVEAAWSILEARAALLAIARAFGGMRT